MLTEKDFPALIEEKVEKPTVQFVEEVLFINGHLIAEGTPFVEET